MKTDSGGRDYKSKYTEKSITGRKADRKYKAQPYIAAGISGRGGPVTVLERLCTVFVQFLFGAVLLFLIAISATMTCGVYGGGEGAVRPGPARCPYPPADCFSGDRSVVLPETENRSGQIQSDGQAVPQAYHRCCRILPDLAADNDVLAEF